MKPVYSWRDYRLSWNGFHHIAEAINELWCGGHPIWFAHRKCFSVSMLAIVLI